MSCWTRRRWLQTAALLSLTSTAPWVRATNAKPHIVIVGGGWGGLGAVRALAESGQVALTLIESNPAFLSCPLSISYLIGEVPLSKIRKSYHRLERLGVRHLQIPLLHVARDLRALLLADGRAITYDYLILSPGITYDWSPYPTLAQRLHDYPVAFRPFEHTALKARWQAFLAAGGGLFLITIPKPPYRCPPAPYERAAMFAAAIKRRGIKGKVVVLDANPNPLPPPIAKPILDTFAQRYAGLIEYYPNQEKLTIDPDRRTVESPAGQLTYAAANIIPPMIASDLIRAAGLGNRYAEVQLPSFRSVADERIYIVGDAAGTPLPKSGHVAFGAGQQAAYHLLAEITGKPKHYAPGEAVQLPAGICWAKMGDHTAIGIHVTANMVVGEAPKLQFQVDSTPTLESYRAAWQWATQQWNAMLG